MIRAAIAVSLNLGLRLMVLGLRHGRGLRGTDGV
jgi:hypothetical protein